MKRLLFVILILVAGCDTAEQGSRYRVKCHHALANARTKADTVGVRRLKPDNADSMCWIYLDADSIAEADYARGK